MINYNSVFVNTDGNSFPNTAGKDSSGPGTTDGTEWVKLFIDDVWGAAQALLNYTDDTPNTVSEADGASQRLESLKKIISNIYTISATGSYTVEAWNKHGVLICAAGLVTVTLAAGIGVDETNRILVYNKTGSTITVNTGAGAETILGGNCVEYVYNGSTAFDRVKTVTADPGYIKADIRVSGTDLIVEDLNIEVNEELLTLAAVTIDISSLTASTWYAVGVDETTKAIVNNPIASLWNPAGLATNQLDMISIYDYSKKYCRDTTGANPIRIFHIFKVNSGSTGVDIKRTIPNFPKTEVVAYNSAGQSAAVTQLLQFPTVDIDINSEWNTSTDIFTSKTSGDVRVDVPYYALLNASQDVGLSIRKNSADYVLSRISSGGSVVFRTPAIVAGKVSLSTSETIDINITVITGGAFFNDQAGIRGTQLMITGE